MMVTRAAAIEYLSSRLFYFFIDYLSNHIGNSFVVLTVVINMQVS